MLNFTCVCFFVVVWLHKKIVLEKNIVIKISGVYDPDHEFDGLIWVNWELSFIIYFIFLSIGLSWFQTKVRY
jgi:hypothetical protein